MGSTRLGVAVKSLVTDTSSVVLISCDITGVTSPG